jgi:hypothetical protein
MSNSGNPRLEPQHASATDVTRVPTLERRERFARKHPEIDIRARSENGRMRFRVLEPGRPGPTIWTDASEMLDDLEKRYP